MFGKDPEAHLVGGTADAVVERKECQFRYERLGERRGREMDGVEGADRLRGKRPSRALHDPRVKIENHPVIDRAREYGPPLCSHSLGHRIGANGPDQHAVALDQRDARREHDLGGTERLTDFVGPGLSEEPGKDRAGFRVKVQRLPRSSLRSLAAEAGGITGVRGR